MFEVGDKVVYPHHGAGTVLAREFHEIRGERREYLTIEILQPQMTVMVPCESAETAGLRPVINERAVNEVLAVLVADGSEMPVFQYEGYKSGNADLPRRYAVTLDFETARKSRNGYQDFDDLRDDPLMILRAGGAEAASAYLDKAKARGNPDTIGNWHIFDEVDPDQPQSSVLLLYGSPGGVRAKVYANEGMPHLRGVETEFGLCGSAGMINAGRYVAVAPRNMTTGVRDLPFTF